MTVNRAAISRFFRLQTIFLAIAAVVAGVFWAVGQEINPLTILVYSICLGNLGKTLMDRAAPLYWDRRFPYNWLIYLLVLAIFLMPIYVISSSLVWWIASPSPQTLAHYLRTGWKFPILITVVFSAGAFLYETTRDRLERRNRELQRTLALGTAQLEQQEEELRRAREIQQGLLPKEIPQLVGFEVAAAWRPAREVSGDYFDVFRLGENRIGFCIADVVGKGVSAALLMANVQAAVRAYAADAESPASLCTKVNRLLCENIATGKFVTFVFGILDSSAHTVAWCNAGHPEPILVTESGREILDHSGAVLGVFPEWKYADERIEMHAGDRLLLFTDGITEAAASDQTEFGEQRIAELALARRSQSATELNRMLLDEVNAFCGSRFQDDATLLVIAAK